MKILVLREKHGSVYFAVPADKEGSVMLYVVKQRDKEGWYKGSLVSEKEKDLLSRCVKEDDFVAAISFFHLRREAEYEGVGFGRGSHPSRCGVLLQPIANPV